MAELGYGFLRHPVDDDNMIDFYQWTDAVDEYMEGGFAYFDIHPGYINGRAESYFKKMVSSRYDRGKYLLADKMPYYGIHSHNDYGIVFRKSLKECGVDFFDYYLLHALNDSHYIIHKKYGGFDFLLEKKRQGLIKKIGFSFHGDIHTLKEILTEHPEMEFVQLQINIADWNNPAIQSSKLYEVAREFGKQIIVMSPIRGGAISNKIIQAAAERTEAQLAKEALSFVASLPGISVILSGMKTKEQVIENRESILNCSTEIDSHLEENEWKRLENIIASLNIINCTECRYCQQVCPKEIAIPEILSLFNAVKAAEGIDETAVGRHRTMYKGTIKSDKRAGNCIHCKACEQRCPQKISISKLMNDAKDCFEDDMERSIMDVDMFVFPYEDIKRDSRIILYGAGVAGKVFYAQICKNNYARIIKWVDRNYIELKKEGLPVDDINIDFENTAFDYVVIAIEKEEIADSIKDFLRNKGIPEEKIIWKYPRLVRSFPEKNVLEEEYIYGYSCEENVQILLSLLKKHGVRKIVISPGTTNMCFSMSAQHDDYFECFSAIDERSAAYMACGMATESGESIVLSCTGATASRNYYPGLTEAYYRKLPVLAVTSSQFFGNVDNGFPQMIDRRKRPDDIAKTSVRVGIPHTDEDRWSCSQLINKAILELEHRGGGPAHIDLETSFSSDYSVTQLPDVRTVNRIEYNKCFPSIDATNICICIGSHAGFTQELTRLIEEFCEKYNGVVLCDHVSNYFGKYSIFPFLVLSNRNSDIKCFEPDLLIHIGEVSAYSFTGIQPKEVWRISKDGMIRDPFKALSSVFEMDESVFFKHYVEEIDTYGSNDSMDYYRVWQNEYARIIPEINVPFSNIYMAQYIKNRLPKSAILHIGILNTNRCWNMIKPDGKYLSYCNTGGFGIDGTLSTAVGASIVSPDKTVFVILGDLSFFYDMNALGNRHIGNNLRILIVNNGCGAEFRTPGHPGEKFGNDTGKYTAAQGHFANQSRNLVRHYAEDLGFNYLSAQSKEEFIKKCKIFLNDDVLSKSIVFETFVEHMDEYEALRIRCDL